MITSTPSVDNSFQQKSSLTQNPNLTIPKNNFQLPVLFFYGQLGDVMSTAYAIDVLKLTEQNPIANNLFQLYGMDIFLILKIYFAALLVGIYFLTAKKYRFWHWSVKTSLVIGTIGTWIVVLLNMIEITGLWKLLVYI